MGAVLAVGFGEVDGAKLVRFLVSDLAIFELRFGEKMIKT